MTVAQNLRRIRKAHKLTQQDIANVLGVDRSTYTLYETGSTSPSIENLEKLSNIYNATVGYILGFEENNAPERIVKEASFVSEDDVDPVAFLPKDEQTLLISYRILSDDEKEELRKKILERLRR